MGSKRAALGTAAIAVVGGAAAVAMAQAVLVPPGPNKLKFPEGWDRQVLYATVDRHDTKQYCEFYSSAAAVQAAKAGQPIPDGTVITLAAHAAKLDEKANLPSSAQAALKSGPSDVSIQGFAFDPGTIKVTAGQSITWTNADDTPHQVTIPGANEQRSDVMLKGQSATLQFDAAGNIAYICGLHPGMKGTIEVAAK